MLAVAGFAPPAGAVPQATSARASWGTPTKIPGLAALLSADGNALVQSPEVFCGAPGNCTLFAYDESYASDPPTIEHLLTAVERNGVWGNAIVVPGTATFSFPAGELCASQGNCVVWYETDAGQAVVVPQTAGVWAAPQQLVDTASTQLDLFSMACRTSVDCTAVGADETGRVVAVSEQHGTWHDPVAIPGVAGLEGPHGWAQATQVVCAAAGTCLVTGLLGNQVSSKEWPFIGVAVHRRRARRSVVQRAHDPVGHGAE